MSEFYRWAEYERIEPFGDYWMIQQGAALVSRVMNATKGKGAKSFKPDDFLPNRPRRNRMSAKDMQTQFRAFAAKHNASLKGKG